MSRATALSGGRLCRKWPVPLVGPSGWESGEQGVGQSLSVNRPMILSLFLLYFPL